MTRRLPLRNSIAFGCALAAALLAAVPFAYAASGFIYSSHKYAWSNVGGWINFAPSNSAVAVSDSALTGYVWSANDGWINLSPSSSGVTNDGAGHLGGFAWDPAAGWISFSGVTIDSAGKFHGMATGGTVDGASYAINFDCSNCDVETNWSSGPPSRTAATSATPGAISPVSSVAPPPPPAASPEAGVPAPAVTVPPPSSPPAAPSAANSPSPGAAGGGSASGGWSGILPPSSGTASATPPSGAVLPPSAPARASASAPSSNTLRNLGLSAAGISILIAVVFFVFKFLPFL